MRRRQVAAEIRTAARAWKERAEGEDDQHMARVYRSDAKDLMKVARLVDEGRIQRARDAAGLAVFLRRESRHIRRADDVAYALRAARHHNDDPFHMQRLSSIQSSHF